jgi:hypothetical protein
MTPSEIRCVESSTPEYSQHSLQWKGLDPKTAICHPIIFQHRKRFTFNVTYHIKQLQNPTQHGLLKWNGEGGWLFYFKESLFLCFFSTNICYFSYTYSLCNYWFSLLWYIYSVGKSKFPQINIKWTLKPYNDSPCFSLCFLYPSTLQKLKINLQNSAFILYNRCVPLWMNPIYDNDYEIFSG